MYFHAGQDFVLNTRDVIGVFDLDTAGASRRTEEYFRHAESEGAVVDLCAPGTLPKSFLVTDFPDETIYISQLSPAALKKRAETGRPISSQWVWPPLTGQSVVLTMYSMTAGLRPSV